MTVLAVVPASAAAGAGLFRTLPGDIPPSPDPLGRGPYRRDTPFTAGAARGSDMLALFAVAPLALRALIGRIGARRLLMLAVAQARLLYPGASRAFGAVAGAVHFLRELAGASGVGTA